MLVTRETKERLEKILIQKYKGVITGYEYVNMLMKEINNDAKVIENADNFGKALKKYINKGL